MVNYLPSYEFLVLYVGQGNKTQKTMFKSTEQIFEHLLCTCQVLGTRNTNINKISMCSSFMEVAV